MKVCRHCDGSGVVVTSKPTRPPAVRGAAAGKLPPFGREVEARAGEGLYDGPTVFCGTCPQTEDDPWQLAAAYNAALGSGAAMVLPAGDSVGAYRWPAPLGTVTACAAGFDRKAVDDLGRALIAAGYDRVRVLHSMVGPREFLAE